MMESPLIELTRSLYHLDYFRRNFRRLGYHVCGGEGGSGGYDCLVCCFKNLFHELSLLMRESVLDPPHIRQTIESSIENAQFGKFRSVGAVPGSVPAHIQFETLLRQLEDCSALPVGVLQQHGLGSPSASAATASSGLKLHTEFSYTKICLHCRTTSYVDSVTQYVMQIDATNFVSDDWPSFEFAVKTALDSGEFCVQPNCHGQTKVFRLLRTLPHFLPIHFSDSASVSLISLLPTRLRPHLIFESSSSVADLLLKGLILYSPEWGHATIFYHSRLELWVFIDSRRVLTLNKSWIESRFHPITHGFTVVFCFYCRDDSAPSSVPNYVPPPTIPTKLPTYPPVTVQKPSYTRIYENWPLDTDSGVSSNGSSASTNSSKSTHEIYASSKTFEDTSSSGGGSRRNSPTKSPSILSSEGKESSNKYATVRRKVKYHGRASKKGALASLSMSAPDLRVLVPPTPAITVAPVALSPVSPVHSNFSDVSSICSSMKGADRSSTSSQPKKVSFNCEVTLVDDPDDEYIPHPIFQSILQKLKHDKNGSNC